MTGLGLQGLIPEVLRAKLAHLGQGNKELGLGQLLGWDSGISVGLPGGKDAGLWCCGIQRQRVSCCLRTPWMLEELSSLSHPQPWNLPGTMWSNSASPRLRFGRVCGLFLVASAHHGKSD